ncbi:uncharacterized protein EI97DRAFT_40609 [Westerdykella ornata]|uniref:Uncharacterized protein n=1 Tax=Westerdykella ornata TaxID=318751 RepID=A0A6A6JIR2_WESOR|nr:uncharacterized protein EI97DRAFT_40609 [Westerdykella ornata]KAF2276461.1 hypothetical protein EI97DRAFT_40609 [Westerdykella ornata]
MALFERKPFAELGSDRLKTLASVKNRQNGLLLSETSPSFKQQQFASSPFKQQPLQSPAAARKRRAPSAFEDPEEDCENQDPSLFSPTKKSKSIDGVSKPSHFSLSVVSSPSKHHSTPTTPFFTTPPVPSVRKALSSQKPRTTNSTPISLTRGSPKHKRVGLLSKRRASSSPFRRVDPPSFTPSSTPGASLPFSIDAALKGSIPDYTPKSSISHSAPKDVSPLPLSLPVSGPTGAVPHASMPSSWFFDIYQDTADEEAAIFMEHSASILDISSDDEEEVKKRATEELGKENVPPEGFVPATWARGMVDGELVQTPATEEATKIGMVEKIKAVLKDEMDVEVNRKPLRALAVEDFYPKSEKQEEEEEEEEEWEEEYEEEEEEKVWAKSSVRPSGLSKEFSFSVEAREREEAAKEAEGNSPVEDKVADVASTTGGPIAHQESIQISDEKDVPSSITTAPNAQPTTSVEDATTPIISATEAAQQITIPAV